MEKLFNEIWKPVKGYEGLYEVSNLGRIKSSERIVLKHRGKKTVLYPQKEMIRTLHHDKGKYLRVALSKNDIKHNFLVHRLVAEAFIPNPKNLPDIDHINTIRDDNRAENLRWCTKKENANNPLTREHLTYQKTNKPIYYIDEQGKKIHFKSISEAARKIGCSQSTMTIALKKNRPVFGIQFYVETEKTTAN